MTDVFLIRHAQASFGSANYDCLSPMGERQSELLGAWMARRGRKPALVVTGQLRRHAQTADGCLRMAGAENSPSEVMPGLDELDVDELIAHLRPDLASPEAIRAEINRDQNPPRAFQTLYAKAVARWVSGAYDHEYRTKWETFRSSVCTSWEKLVQMSNRETWVFTSGGPIGVIVAALIGLPMERAFELSWPLVNTSVTRIRIGSNTQQLVTFNAWAHLEDGNDKSFITHR